VEAISRLVAQSLLYVAGETSFPKSLDKLTASLAVHFEHSPLSESLETFSSELLRLRHAFDDVSFERMAQMQDLWTVLAADICQTFDSQLELQASLPTVQPLAKAV
jgi:hypothetical protein